MRKSMESSLKFVAAILAIVGIGVLFAFSVVLGVVLIVAAVAAWMGGAGWFSRVGDHGSEEYEREKEAPHRYREGDLVRPEDIDRMSRPGISWGWLAVIISAMVAAGWGFLSLHPPLALTLFFGLAFGLVAMGFFLGYVPALNFGVLLKADKLTGHILGSGAHWIVPFFWRRDLINTKERVDKVVGLTAALKDGFTVTIHAFVRWSASQRLARFVGGLITNVFYRKRATAVRRGMEEALESEITALVGATTLEQFVRMGASLRTIFQCYFQVHRRELPHYDQTFIARVGIWKPEVAAAGTVTWRSTAGWAGGSIPSIYRLEFYELNRLAIIELLESEKLVEVAESSESSEHSTERDESSNSRYEEENGIVVHEVGFNAILSEEAKKNLQAAARTSATSASAKDFARIDKDAVAAALAVQGISTHTTMHMTGVHGEAGGGDPIGLKAAAGMVVSALMNRDPDHKGKGRK